MALSSNQKQLGLLLLFFVAALAFWNTVFLYPVKIFVVLLHEISHGLMAMAAGGSIIEIQISPQIGGYCKYTAPAGFFSQMLIASAGYLGSLIFGSVILWIAIRSEKDRILTLVIGILTLFFSYFVIQTGEAFGIVFSLAFSVFMIASAFFLGRGFHDLWLKFLGLTSCLYAIIDIADDLIFQSGIGSDADRIAQLTGIPSVAVGVFWMALALAWMVFVMVKAFSKPLKKGSQS